jgi:hypothetical protein
MSSLRRFGLWKNPDSCRICKFPSSAMPQSDQDLSIKQAYQTQKSKEAVKDGLTPIQE